MRFASLVIKIGFCCYLERITRDEFCVQAIGCRKRYTRGNANVLLFWRDCWRGARSYAKLQQRMADRGVGFYQVREAIEQEMYRRYKEGLIRGDETWSKLIWVNDGDGYTLRRRWTTERSE